MTRPAYVREDMGLITIDGDPTPWGSAEGGAVVTNYNYRRRQIEDLTLERVRRDDSPPDLIRLTKRVGDRATVTVAHLDQHGNPTGNGFVYEGTLTRVVLAPYDADGNNAAMDRVVLHPSKLYAIGDSAANVLT